MSGYIATILVADDDPDIAELVEIHLAGVGFRVFKAYDGAEALKVFGREKIDLAILDIMMPEWMEFRCVKESGSSAQFR